MDDETSSSAAKRLDIFRVLNAADKKDARFFAELTEDEQKQLQPFLIERWMTGTSDAGQVYMLNELVNKYAFTFTHHKHLLWQLITISATGGRAKRYTWIKPPTKRESGKPNALRVLKQAYGYNTKHAIDALELLSRDEVIDIAEQLGWQPDDIAKVRKELKGEGGSDTKKSTKSNNDLLEF